MNFDLSDLRAFVASADPGSVRAAADTLNLSPLALSRRVEKLEDALGVRLFERPTRKMELTVAGRSFVEKARHVLSEPESCCSAWRTSAIACPASWRSRACHQRSASFCQARCARITSCIRASACA
nr:LysR family transcriptional regulator [Paraburkholderia silvatlantica]